MPQVRFMDGFEEGRVLGAIDCADGGGRIDRYELFDGVTVMRVSLQTHGFEETRRKRDGLEINFCASGRFESSFSARDQAALTPGGMLAVWSAAPDPAFARRLKDAGFAVEEVAVRARSNGKGPRHTIWFGRKR